jgi:hypothetical protein
MAFFEIVLISIILININYFKYVIWQEFGLIKQRSIDSDPDYNIFPIGNY